MSEGYRSRDGTYVRTVHDFSVLYRYCYRPDHRELLDEISHLKTYFMVSNKLNCHSPLCAKQKGFFVESLYIGQHINSWHCVFPNEKWKLSEKGREREKESEREREA